jgi:hypothetical protein
MQQNQTKIFTDVGALNTVSKDENFDADKVWNKLEQKLTKKKSKKVYWIWLAASMLILISIPAFFKTNKSTKNIIAPKIILPKKIAVDNTSKQIVVSKKSVKKEVEKHLGKKQNLALDTFKSIVQNIQPIALDTSIKILKGENKIVITSTTIKPIRKKLKVVYASDLYDNKNVLIKQQELANEQPKKPFFKLFESSNKELEEAPTTENQPQTNKTFLGFKSKPTAAISINENQ